MMSAIIHDDHNIRLKYSRCEFFSLIFFLSTVPDKPVIGYSENEFTIRISWKVS